MISKRRPSTGEVELQDAQPPRLFTVRRYDEDSDKKALTQLVQRMDHRVQVGMQANEGQTFNEDSYHVTFVAVVGNLQVGFGTAKCWAWGAKGFLSQAYVEPQWRRKGISRALIRARLEYMVENWTILNGVEVLTIENPAMEHILASEGFTWSGTYKQHAVHGVKLFDQSCWRIDLPTLKAKLGVD